MMDEVPKAKALSESESDPPIRTNLKNQAEKSDKWENGMHLLIGRHESLSDDTSDITGGRHRDNP